MTVKCDFYLFLKLSVTQNNLCRCFREVLLWSSLILLVPWMTYMLAHVFMIRSEFSKHGFMCSWIQSSFLVESAFMCKSVRKSTNVSWIRSIECSLKGADYTNTPSVLLRSFSQSVLMGQFSVVSKNLGSKKKQKKKPAIRKKSHFSSVCEAASSAIDEWLSRCGNKWIQGRTRTLIFYLVDCRVHTHSSITRWDLFFYTYKLYI